MTAASMLAAARKDLGLVGRPNHITRDYSARHGRVFLRAAWCNMSVTYWARRSGNASAVLPGGDRAFTVWHAQDGQRAGLWCPGTAANIRAYARPGAIVFFDWGGSDSVGAIDHVGIVERNLGDGRVQTIEGNTADACKRRVRAASVIAGFWNPAYSSDEEDDVSAKDVWNHEIEVSFGKPDNPEWQAKSILVNSAERLRSIEAKVDGQTVAIKALVEALAARDGEIDVEALVSRIQQEIEKVTVRLDIGG